MSRTEANPQAYDAAAAGQRLRTLGPEFAGLAGV